MLAVVVLAFAWGGKPAGPFVAFLTVLLAGSVLAAVHHAEVVAHRVGSHWARSCSRSRSP